MRMVASTAAAVLAGVALVGGPVAGGGEASGAPLPHAPARAHVMLPPHLRTLEHKMLDLRVNSARATTKLVTVSPVEKKTEGFFEVLPTRRRHHGGRASPRVKRTVVSGLVEVSESPSLERARGGFGPLKFELRRIGGDVYERIPLLEQADHGYPWVESTRRERASRIGGIEAGLGSASVGGIRRSDFARVARLFADAKSVRYLGSRTIAESGAAGFEARLSARAVFAKLFATKAKGSASKLLRRAERTLEKATVTMRVWFERDGLPVETTVAFGRGSSWTTEHSRILATEVPISVTAPPASETITEKQLRRERARTIEEARSPGSHHSVSAP